MFDFDKDYLYHSFSTIPRDYDTKGKISLENILKDGYILSKRNIFGEECSQIECGFNGYNYISLSKKTSSNSLLNDISQINVSKLSQTKCFNLRQEIWNWAREIQREAFYRYVPFNITFIFKTNIGEINTKMIPNRYFFEKYTNDGDIRYSDLLGEVQIKDKLDINEAVAVYVPYYIKIFVKQLEAKIHKQNNTDINPINQKTLELLDLIENYLPNIPIVDICSKKVFTKSISNDIIK